MKISLKWISDFVDVSDALKDPSDLSKSLTRAGLEVEGVEDQGGQFKNVVVGHIKEKGVHPDADRLTLCQVDVGDGKLRQIVCGAKNHKAGDKVVVALPGAVLPGNFEIKLSKIRGVESQGMLSSESELGLSKESEGILILPSDAPVGKPFAEFFGLNDVLIEINVTPNRADCLSHYGLARELSCILNRPLKTLDFSLKGSSGLKVQNKIQLSVPAKEMCPRYMGRYIEGVKVGPSSSWLKERLESVGMNSINNVVDITNYVMMELGQPLHAFDASQIKGAKVIVDKSKAGEMFTTLDGTQLKLTGDELTIRDTENALCLAGVVGGKNSGVTDLTTDIFLESAHFTMDSVRKTSRRFGLQTDSAYRFSRGTDISMVEKALNRAAALLAKECGGKVSEDVWDIYPEQKKTNEIEISVDYVSERLGYPVDAKEFAEWMNRLGLTLKKSSGPNMTFQTPSHRVDLEQDVDLVEEFGRLNGYEKIPEIFPVIETEPLQTDMTYTLHEEVGASLWSYGYSQAVNYGFTSSKKVSEYFSGSTMGQNLIPLKNPLNEDLDVMRPTLAVGMIENLFHNMRYGNQVGRLFETGFRFSKSEKGILEEGVFALLSWGQLESIWQKPNPKSPLFFEVKGVIETLCRKFQIGGAKGLLQEAMFSSLEFRPWVESVPAFLHPGQAASIFCEGKTVGYIGALHPALLEAQKISSSAVYVEMEMSAFERAMTRSVKAQTPAKFQAVERDLTFVTPVDMNAQSVIQVIKKTVGELLQSVTVTDVFQGGDLGADKKSLSFRMIYLDKEGTLSEQKLTELQASLISQVEKKLSVKLR